MSSLDNIALEIIGAIMEGNKVMIFGVGGNAASASHFAGELAGKYEQYEDPLPVICLNDNMAVVTAITNDFGWDQVFSRQIKGLGKKGDVVIAFSISGGAKYLENAFIEARKKGCVTVLLNGNTTPKVASLCDYLLAVDSDNTPRVQEIQLRWVHDLSERIKSNLKENYHG